MIDLTVGLTVDLSSHQSQSPTEIDFFAVGKEAGIKRAGRPIVFGTNEEAGSAGPMHFLGGVVLSVVTFETVEDSSATEGVAVSIDKSTAGSGIFKRVAMVKREEFGLAGGDGRIGVHEFDERREPLMSHFDIRVEQHEVFGLNLCQGAVVALGEAPVSVKGDGATVGEMLCQEGERVVGRGIVGYDDVGLIARVAHHRGEESFEHLSSVPVKYHNGYFRHGALRLRGDGTEKCVFLGIESV